MIILQTEYGRGIAISEDALDSVDMTLSDFARLFSFNSHQCKKNQEEDAQSDSFIEAGDVSLLVINDKNYKAVGMEE